MVRKPGAYFVAAGLRLAGSVRSVPAFRKAGRPCGRVVDARRLDGTMLVPVIRRVRGLAMDDGVDVIGELPEEGLEIPCAPPRSRRLRGAEAAAASPEDVVCRRRLGELRAVVQRMREAGRIIEDRVGMGVHSFASERAATLERSRLAMEALCRAGVLDASEVSREWGSRADLASDVALSASEALSRLEALVRAGLARLFADPSGSAAQVRMIALHRKAAERMVSRVAAIALDVGLVDAAWHASLHCLDRAREGARWTSEEAADSTTDLAWREEGRLMMLDLPRAVAAAEAGVAAAKVRLKRAVAASAREDTRRRLEKAERAEEAARSRSARWRRKGRASSGLDLLDGVGTD